VKSDRAHNRWPQKLEGRNIPGPRWETDSNQRLGGSCLARRLFDVTPGRQRWNPPSGKFIRRLFGGPPTGFSESDGGEFICRFYGRPPDHDSDIGLVVDELESSELDRNWFPDDEIRNGYCLTMDSRRFQVCRN
jgi:hypothetical protein